MLGLILVCAAASTGLISWVIAGVVRKALQRYRDVFTHTARVELGEFFLFIDPAHLWMCNLLVCGLAAATMFTLTSSVLASAAGAVAAIVLPRSLLAHLRIRRRRQFDAQLPDALLAIASAMRAGAGTATALRHVVAEADPPLSQELDLVLRELRVGVNLDTALNNLCTRMPTEATALTTSAMRLANFTGGSLAEALERIATTVRARLHMEGRIQALTAQGRLQAWVLGALPFLLILALHQLEPEVMAQLWRTPAGWATLAAIVVLEAVGLWLIRRIVRIDV